MIGMVHLRIKINNKIVCLGVDASISIGAECEFTYLNVKFTSHKMLQKRLTINVNLNCHNWLLMLNYKWQSCPVV